MIRTTAAAAALAALAAGPAAAKAEPERPDVLVVVAHPDDELFMAPAIAALAREGRSVRIVHVTPGDAGPGLSGLPKGEALAAVRRAEADCAGKALGVSLVVNFGFYDGDLEDHARDGSLAETLVDEIEDADLILTWGPDGGYGHADHRLVSSVVTQLVQAMPAAKRPKLLYVGIPNGTLPPLPQMSNWATTEPGLLTVGVAYTPTDLAAATRAAQCHETQFDAYSRDGMMTMFDATIWQGKVHFRPAF